MVTCEVDCVYLENLVGISFVHLETLDGHRASHIFSVAYICVATMMANHPDVYELLLKNIRGGYYLAGSADLGKKSQTPLPEFALET